MKHLSRTGIKRIALMSLSLMLLSAFIVACGGGDEAPASAPAAAAPAAAAPAAAEPAKEAPKAAAAPTAVPAVKPTVAPVAATVAKDSIVVVINQEPTEPDPWMSTTLYPNQVIHNISQPF